MPRPLNGFYIDDPGGVAEADLRQPFRDPKEARDAYRARSAANGTNGWSGRKPTMQ
jgi:hypothetical protein